MLRKSGGRTGGSNLMKRTCKMYAEKIFFGGVTGTKNTLGFQVLIEVKINNGIKKAYMKPQVLTQELVWVKVEYTCVVSTMTHCLLFCVHFGFFD